MTGTVNFTTGQLLGTVLAVQANFYQVQLDITDKEPQENNDAENLSPTISASSTPPMLLCTRRTRLKKIGQQVMVGDRVVIEEPDWAGGRGAIADVLPRQTQLDRPPIANVNQILLVFAVADPPLEAYQLSRFLVKAESTGLDVVLCLNKSDLISPQMQQQISDRLLAWGYQPLFISVQNSINIDQISHYLNQRITVIAGPSGVGKSSLINSLVPDVNLRVGEVSGKLARGRHTTRHVELFELPSKGLLADTPGFNQPDLDCTPEELVYYFPEARERLATGSCRFSDCLHRDEPDCVVRGDWERYEHYLEFLVDAIAYQTQRHQQADPESTLKLKTKGKGQAQYEPKLESKKYRRVARKTQLQALQDLYQDSEE
ncbi:small ribosomal subunit biogenesis GTPase RsgA [Calothrix sp. FACHB-1219]|uniref:small ribosomal subunit biogenesis GTPase RsgA n=1 Tax=unclassified Calothrix TaxID=2619626 RepID=UPI001687F101|nr:MULTISPECIES: small ribosomal subunit biogenesis GTPase RsgA [unclassified Calothrix]MBD2201003.1 small ribosomal subunit biogenesis GTPase RsgA [Calothrix sp. FACHB-168]MBD2215436.1 small ribosomal subunit biogenesis GTPase RsgA [Calothrix sp. FACHB-1219]